MAFKFNTDFINLGPLTSTNFGIEPIDVSNVGPVAPLSNANLLASASRASTSPVLNLSALQTTTPATTYEFDPTEFVGPVAPKATTTTTPSPLNTITLTPRTEQRDFTPAPVGSFETLKINPTLASKPTTTFDPGEFVGPVAPGSPKPSPTTATDLTLTPSFLTQTQAEADVKGAFDRVLGRQPFEGPGSGLEYWTNELVKGNVTLANLDQAIAQGAQGGDRLAANKFLGTNYFKVADPTTLPYASLLQPTQTVTNQPSVIETYNQKAQEREEKDKPLFNTWEDLPNIDETEIQMAKDAGYQSPGAYFLAKIESTDPLLSSWRESTRQEILGSKNLRKQYEDLYKAPIDKDAEETIYQELKTQYDLAAEGGYKYKHESDLDEIFRSEAAKLAAGGVKSIYEIGTRTTPQSLTFSDVYEVDGKYFYKEYYSDDQSNQIEIRPDKILDVKQDYRTVYDDDTGQYIERPSGLTVVVEDKPKTELINKSTGDPLYDVILQGNYREDPTSYKFRGNETIDVETRRGYERIHYNTKVRDMADYSFQMISDGQGNEIPFMVPVFKSTKTDLTPVALLAAAFLGPYAMQIGSALGATTMAGQAALGAGVISGGTQLVVNGKIDPSRLAVSMATAGLAQTGGFTGSDIAADAAQLAEQGLSSAQIADTLVSSGVNSVTANLAGTFASAGISVEIAPMITAGTQNMGLTALAMGELDADALTKSFLAGASGEASNLAVDKIIGEENLQIIADATGLSKDQAGSIATSALTNGMNAEILGTDKSFLDAVTETLVVSGVSTATANKVATALDDMTSSKGRAAIVGATKNIMDVAGTAAWNDMDVGDALETMAPTIIGNAISTYVRTPDIPKADDKTKTARLDGVEVAGEVSGEALSALADKPLISETASEPVTDENNVTRRVVTGTRNDGSPYEYAIEKQENGDAVYRYIDSNGLEVTSGDRPNFNELDAPIKAPGSGMRIDIFGVGDSSPKDGSGKFEVQEQSFLDRLVNATTGIDLRQYGDQGGSGYALVGGGGYGNVSKGLPFNFLGVDEKGYQKYDINGNQFTAFVLPNKERSSTQVLASIFSDDVFTVELVENEDGTKTPKLNSSSAKDVLQGAVKGAQSESGSNQGAEAAEVALAIVGEAGESGDQSSADVIGGWLETVIEQGSEGSGSSLGGVGGGTGTGSTTQGAGTGSAGEGAGTGSGGTGVGGAGSGGSGIGSGTEGSGSGTEGGGSGAGSEGSGTGGSDVGTGPGVTGQGDAGPGTGQDGTDEDGDGKRGTGGGGAPVKTTKKAEGAGAGMALSALGSLSQEDDTGLSPLRTTGKREFESPLAAFMRMVSGEENVEPPPVEKKEPSMDYYSYGKSAEIDDVLGDVTPSGLPNFEFAELGEMGPSFQMRSGGLVPPFAGGGPLTMAAGKLRKDYRQGDAVEGPGDGQSDDIPAMLADGEFVLPADVVAALGNGSNKAGADKLYDMMHNIRRQARQGNPKDLPKPAKSPLQYMTRR